MSLVSLAKLHNNSDSCSFLLARADNKDQWVWRGVLLLSCVDSGYVVSIKPEISKALDNLLDEIHTVEDTKVI